MLDTDAEGPLPKVNVSVKLSALYSQINDRAWDETKFILKERLRPLFRKAMEKTIFLNLDMEQNSVKHLTVDVYKEILSEPEFKNYKFFGCVIQAYLKDSSADIRDLCAFAKTRGTPFTVRLVKGAYWDYETIDSEQKNWEIPVYTIKAESDANYEVCAQILLENYPHIKGAFASHNVRTLASVLYSAEKRNVPKNGFEIQMLFGMGEPIKKTFSEMGYRVREYSPVGELIPGMAYLVRRLLENTSNESWLRGKFAENKSIDELLADPKTKIPVKAATASNPTSIVASKKGFVNEPLSDFAIEGNRKFILDALKNFKVESVKTVLPEVNFKSVSTNGFLDRENPSQTNQILARIGLTTQEIAETAIQESHKAFHVWKKTTPGARSAYIRKLARMMHDRKWQLMATQIFEVGKPWAEADGDIGEAIDFCNYYADHIDQLSSPLRVGNVPGEVSQYIYTPRGVCVAIAPWNFPLAILCGQVAAALVTGNTVIIKPAEQSSLMAQSLYNMIKELNLPTGTVQFLPGLGEVVGEYLVNHALTSTYLK